MNQTNASILGRDGPLCHYCRVYMQPGDITREHIVPRSLGGPSSFDNLVLACAPCNRARANFNAPHKWCEFCAAARARYAPVPLVRKQAVDKRRKGRVNVVWPGSGPKVDGHLEA